MNTCCIDHMLSFSLCKIVLEENNNHIMNLNIIIITNYTIHHLIVVTTHLFKPKTGHCINFLFDLLTILMN